MSKKVCLHKQLLGALLVAGTTIGAGMLALPLSCAEAGFGPSCLLNLMSWLFMTSTAILLIEVCVWMPKDSNIVSMAAHILGRKGRIAAWLLYLLLFYSLTVAYISGGGRFVTSLFGGGISLPVGTLLFVSLFAPIVYKGAHTVGRANFGMMAGMLAAYLCFVVFGVSKVQGSLLSHVNWSEGFYAFPIIFVSFAFQGLVPSLFSYLEGDAKTVRRVVFLGSLIPLFLNLLWVFLILGIIPLDGPFGLIATKDGGKDTVANLSHFVGSPYLIFAGKVFAFLALTTSFMGVTLGLLDFFIDGFGVDKQSDGKWKMAGLVFIPTTLVAIFNPNIFIVALTYAGGLGTALLLGLLPVLMAWKGRYHMDALESRPLLRGGRLIMSLLLLFLAMEVFFTLEKLLR